MDKPTLKQIKKKYKNAKEVRCVTSGDIVNISKEIEYKIHYEFGCYWIGIKNYSGGSVNLYRTTDNKYAEIISYKEPLYKLTAKEVVHAYENPEYLKYTFKECFETELEVGKWYKYSDRIGFIVYIEKVLSNTLIKGYGISNCWNDSREWVKEGLEPATEKEVEEALQKEQLQVGRKPIKQALEDKCKYIVLLNNDTVVPVNWTKRFIAGLNQNYKIMGIGPFTNTKQSWQGISNCINKIGLIYNIRHYIPMLEKLNINAANKYLYQMFGDRIIYIDGMIAFFCVMFRAEIFNMIGLLDEDFGAGLFDDDDYCQRIHKVGYKTVLHLGVLVQHNHRTTFNEVYDDNGLQSIYNINKAKYEKKYNIII